MAATATLLTRDIQGESLNAATDRLVNELAFNEGVVDKAGNSFQVLQNLGTDMNVKIGSGTAFDRAVVKGDLAGQGSFIPEHQNATQVLAVAASDPTNNRIDLVILRVYDDTFDSSTDDFSDLELVTGTPSGSPVAPALPSTALLLAEILVVAADTQIVNGDITDKREEYTLVQNLFAGWQLELSATQLYNTGAADDETDVPWGTEDLDSHGFHSGSDAIVTVPAGVDGFYQVHFQGFTQATTADQDASQFALKHNSTNVANTFHQPSGATNIQGTMNHTILWIVKLVATDTLKIVRRVAASGEDFSLFGTAAGETPVTWFSGHRIAR